GYKSFLQKGVLTNLWVGFSIPRVPWLRYSLIRIIGKRMIDRYIREHGVPDILHLHVFVAAEVAVYASQRYGLPLVWTEHFSDVARNNISESEKKLILNLLAYSKTNIAVSPFLATKLKRNFNAPFKVLPNVYDSFVFTRNKSVQKHSKFTFLSVAYMHPIKNHQRMLNAFQLLSDLPVALVLVGIGDMYDW